MKKKVFVGLSGGVDSSVSAALLKEQGYDVVGVFIKTWQPDFLPCTWRAERRDAMRVAAHLRIPFVTLDCEKEYKEGVAEQMIAGYKQGIIPNPDVLCNERVKFSAFADKAFSLGADYVATGHYAERGTHKHTEVIKRGKDQAKDQAYFLWKIDPSYVSRILFPVGHLEKADVRKEAVRFGLPTATKKDSQGICFLGPVSMKDFLAHYIPKKEGKVISVEGDVLGTHDGAYFFGLGERHGFTIEHTKGAEHKPWYVVGRDIEENTLIVDHTGRESSVKERVAYLTDVNWFVEGEIGKVYISETRYHDTPYSLVLEDKKGDKATLRGDLPLVSAGQSIVLYEGDVMVGGGVVAIDIFS